MADKISKFFSLDDFLNQEIPQEIADKLKVAGRVEQILRPTRASAVSTSAQDDLPDAEVSSVNKEIDELIDHVAAMEDLVEQLEDMSDDHLKDMAIPSPNNRVSAAAKRLGSPNGEITKDVLDQAQLINQVAPILLTGNDPIAITLTGQGILDPNSGSFLNCNEITRALVKQLRLLENSDINNAEVPIEDLNQDINSAHEDSLARIMLEIILKMIWNIIWVKLIVDHGIINPGRILVANPLDNIILFFKKDCGFFKRPSKECLQRKGPINKLLNKLRIILICKIPPKFYKRFDPMEHDVRCPKEETVCKDQTEGRSMESDKDLKEKGSLKKMGEIVDELFPDLCLSTDDLLGLARCTDPTGPGLPPECYNAANIILQAILDDALSASSSKTKDKSTESQKKQEQTSINNEDTDTSREEIRKKGCLGGGYYAR